MKIQRRKTIRKPESARLLPLETLLKQHIYGILNKERKNVSFLHLYRTDDYWVAFEYSSYLLSNIDSQTIVYPIKIAVLTRPFTMASLSNDRLKLLSTRLHCLQANAERRTYESRMPFSENNYRTWHQRQLKTIVEAMEKGII